MTATEFHGHIWSSHDNDALRASFNTCVVCGKVCVSEYEEEPRQ